MFFMQRKKLFKYFVSFLFLHKPPKINLENETALNYCGFGFAIANPIKAAI